MVNWPLIMKKNLFNFFVGSLITAVFVLSSCDLFTSDTDINRGVYSGPISYRVYTYTKDTTLPAFRTYSEKVEITLKEDKEGLFIEHDSKKYHFDKDNKINITTDKGYLKYFRNNNAIDLDSRSDETYTDSTVSMMASGTLRKN